MAGASHSNAQALPDSHRLPTRPWPQLSSYSWRHKTTSERHYRHVIMSFNRLAVAQNCLDPWAHKMLSIRHTIGYPLFSGFGIWPQDKPEQRAAKQKCDLLAIRLTVTQTACSLPIQQILVHHPPKTNNCSSAAQQRSFPKLVHNVGVRALAHQVLNYLTMALSRCVKEGSLRISLGSRKRVETTACNSKPTQSS